MSVIKRRSANYSKAELDCLLSYLEDNPELLCAKLGGQYKTMNDIRVGWDELADKISAIGGYFGTKRAGQEVKRKWADLKSRVKAKAASIAMEPDTPEGVNPNLKLTPLEERVLGIITQNYEEMSERTSALGLQEIRVPAVKVFSFHNNESNSEDGLIRLSECDENERNQSGNVSESEIVEEIKVSGSEDKKRRISEAFSAAHAERKALALKKLKIVSEEEQLQELCNSQQEINCELRSIKDILKKCQVSIEKIALLKRAELRLKCAKYGVDFDDLFD